MVEKFKYLGVTVTNMNDIRVEIKRRISIGNACYYSLSVLYNFTQFIVFFLPFFISFFLS